MKICYIINFIKIIMLIGIFYGFKFFFVLLIKNNFFVLLFNIYILVVMYYFIIVYFYFCKCIMLMFFVCCLNFIEYVLILYLLFKICNDYVIF